MPKAIWVSCYRSIKNPDALAAYAKLAGPALEKHGAKFLARGVPTVTHENGLKQRLVIIEFPSIEQAEIAYKSADYAEALKALGDGADRDIRIIEAI